MLVLHAFNEQKILEQQGWNVAFEISQFNVKVNIRLENKEKWTDQLSSLSHNVYI